MPRKIWISNRVVAFEKTVHFCALFAVFCLTMTLAHATGDVPSAHFPPNPQVEWKHLRLDIKVPDLNARAFDGKATYTVAASGQRAESLRLDAADMEIVAVKGNDGNPLEWSHDDGVLQIRLREAIGPRVADQAATPLQFSIEYRVREPRQGMKFSSAIPGVDGQAGMAAEIHTQG
ncbi:MAG: hypothetical protein RL692_588, partial [Planctomycetota bacterium]